MAEIATRRERVVLELEDNFTTKMAKAAAAAQMLDRSLSGLSGSAVRSRGIDRVSRDIDKVGDSSRGASSDIDRFSGRLGLLRDVALTLGPAFVPLGAVVVPAVAGLAAQMGAAALAGGTMIAAFQGVGGALEAVNKAALEPTADNLEAARIAMEQLGPEARSMVNTLQDFRPALLELRNAAAAGLFPGLEAAIGDLEGSLPAVERLLYAVGDAAGDVAGEFAEGFAGPRGQEFLAFMTAEVPAALSELGSTVGNLAAGMGELWMAFTPLNRDFSGWLLEASRGFDDWATGLSQTQGFEDFVSYIRENGPRVADAMGAIGNAVVQLVTAAAPLGGPTLAALEAVADVIAAIAGSPAGPALIALASGLAIVSRSIKAIEAVKASSMFSGIGVGADGAAKSMSKLQRAAAGAAAGLAGFAVVDALQGGLEDYSIGVETMTQSILDMNDAASADLPSNLDGLSGAIDRLANPGRAEALQDTISNALGGIGNEEEYDRSVALIESIEASLVGLVATGDAVEAEEWLAGLNMSDSTMANFLSLMPQYEDALAGVENEARLAGEAGSEAGRRIAQGFGQAQSAAQRFRAEIERANRVLEGRSSMRDYEAAIDDLTASVRQNGRTLDINTNKGRQNQAALDGIATSALAVAEGMKGSNRVAFLQKARGDMIDAARKLGLTRAQAQALADKLGLVDQMNVNPQINADTARAEGNVRNLLNAMAQLRDRTVTVTTVFTQSGRRFKDFDTGGYTGDGHYLEPRGVVHAGEVVIPKHLVTRDWAMLRNRYGHLPGFSSGGVVGSTAVQQQRVSVASRQSVEFAPAVVDLRYPNGDVQRVEMIATAAANRVVNAQLEHDRVREGR